MVLYNIEISNLASLTHLDATDCVIPILRLNNYILGPVCIVMDLLPNGSKLIR